MSTVLSEVLSDGRMLVLEEEAGIAEGWATIREQVLEAAESVCGPAARARLTRDGLGALHEVLPAEAIGQLRDEVMPRVRATLFEVTCRVAREVLGVEDPFYVDDYTILRVNYPYEVALNAPMTTENPGIGRVSDGARRAAGTRVVDPVYDPRGYHRDQPPAAWAHGPHLDTWTGHSRDGVNLWWAIGDVLAENSMFFYPELFGVPLSPDPTSLYLREGRPLPRPVPMPLRAGQMLVFNPEVLHGTHLNVSGRTRVAASTRINAREPAFDPTCFYAREFWHDSKALDAGDLETLTRFPRESHLAPPPVQPSADEAPDPVPRVRFDPDLSQGEWCDVAAAQALASKGKLLLVASDDEPLWLLCRTTDRLWAVGARCPHLGSSLSDGHHDSTHLTCPAHAVRFELCSGKSPSPVLRLATAEIRERAGRLELRTGAP